MEMPIQRKQYLIIVITTGSGEFRTDWRSLCGFTAGGSDWDLLVVDGGVWRDRFACSGAVLDEVVASILSDTHSVAAYTAIVCIHHGLFDSEIQRLLADDPRCIAVPYSTDILGAPKARVLFALRSAVGIAQATFLEVRRCFDLNSNEQRRLNRALQGILPPPDFAAISHDVLAAFHTLSSVVQNLKTNQDPSEFPPSEDAESAFSKARARLYVRRGLLANLRAAQTAQGYVWEHWSDKAQQCWERVSRLLPESASGSTGGVDPLYSDCRHMLSLLEEVGGRRKVVAELSALAGSEDPFNKWRAALRQALDGLADVYAGTRAHGPE